MHVSVAAGIGLRKSRLSSVVIAAQPVLRLILGIVLLLLGAAVYGVVLAHTVSVAFAALLGLALIMRSVSATSQPSSTQSWKDVAASILGFGLPAYAAKISFGLFSLSQNLVLARFVTNEELGYFAVAVNFMALFNIINLPIQQTLFSSFAYLSSSQEAELNRFYNFGVKLVSFLLVPASLFVLLFSGDLVDLLYGQQYGRASLYVSLYVSVFLLCGVGLHVNDSYLNGTGRVRKTMLSNLFQLAVLLFVGVALTAFFGVIGMLLSVIVAVGSKVFLLNMMIRHELRISVEKVLPVYLTAGAAIGVSYAVSLVSRLLFNHGFIPGILVFTLTALVLAPKLGAITKDELAYLLSNTKLPKTVLFAMRGLHSLWGRLKLIR